MGVGGNSRATRRGSSASLRRRGAERPVRPAPRAPHLGGHGGRFPGPGGSAGLPRCGASALGGRGGRLRLRFGGSAAAARRGGSASALLSALRPPRLGDSRRRPRLQFLKVPGCAAPAPAGQASHGPRRARRKRAWGLGRSPASSPAPASALTPPPEAPSTGALARAAAAGPDGRRGRGLVSAAERSAEENCASGSPRAGGRRSPGADGSHPPGIRGPRRGCWRGRGA